MSAKYQIKKELEFIKWVLKNPLVKCEDKMTPLYESAERIEQELSKL